MKSKMILIPVDLDYMYTGISLAQQQHIYKLYPTSHELFLKDVHEGHALGANLDLLPQDWWLS